MAVSLLSFLFCFVFLFFFFVHYLLSAVMNSVLCLSGKVSQYGPVAQCKNHAVVQTTRCLGALIIQMDVLCKNLNTVSQRIGFQSALDWLHGSEKNNNCFSKAAKSFQMIAKLYNPFHSYGSLNQSDLIFTIFQHIVLQHTKWNGMVRPDVRADLCSSLPINSDWTSSNVYWFCYVYIFNTSFRIKLLFGKYNVF